MILPNAREGTRLKVKQRHVDFSYWPTARNTRRYGLQPFIFVTDPWSVVRHSIEKRCPTNAKVQARAFMAQSHDYFRAAEVAGLFTAKPVLLYYSFLNLVKAFVLTEGVRTNYGAARHGLSEKMNAGGRELINSFLEAKPSGQNAATNPQSVNIFDDFIRALTGRGLNGTTQYQMTDILPQLLQGHRLWCAASREHERFVAVTKIDILQEVVSKVLWIVLNISEDDLTRLNIQHNHLLQGAGLQNTFQEVKSDEVIGGIRLLKFEQITPKRYSHRPSDIVLDLVSTIKPNLSSNVLSVPPYRKHYVYVAPGHTPNAVLPQLAAIYAFFFYLGSITRYKPQVISNLVQGDFAAQLEESVINLPNQFLYLMASEFSHQEVTRAAIV